jgi:hypothetical protein
MGVQEIWAGGWLGFICAIIAILSFPGQIGTRENCPISVLFPNFALAGIIWARVGAAQVEFNMFNASSPNPFPFHWDPAFWGPGVGICGGFGIAFVLALIGRNYAIARHFRQIFQGQQ